MLKTRLAACLMMLFSTGCVGVADSLCTGTKRILPNAPQVDAMEAEPILWRSLAEQIVTHNGSLTKAGCP